ncbi:hypothetical protein [Bradyrhizobium betae]|uniref:hypothetical protein n=1 Tax=Bradyrhizobium betae TaxID=244734 RepID=UPI00100EA662|nr:hypothetical protein [Bradyrhizobium betae]
MSRKSALSRHASSIVEPELPLGAYFLSVGGALLLLLLAADWVLPAPVTSRLTDSHSALPPIRIHSEMRGPDAVVIDTNVSLVNPAPAENESGAATSPMPPPEVADSAADVSETGSASSTDARLRESLAQLQSAVPDRADPGRRPPEITARRRLHAQRRTARGLRSARHPHVETLRGDPLD